MTVPSKTGRNLYEIRSVSGPFSVPTEQLLIDRAELLGLSVPEMAVLVGGLRVIGANHGASSHGVLTDRPGQLTNNSFANLLDVGTAWKAGEGAEEGSFVRTDRASGEAKWTATRVDLAFGSNSQLRAISEVYAADDARSQFVRDLIAA